MIKQLSKIFVTVFPYICVLLFWNFSCAFWNPAGILALIPIFYFSFRNPQPFFPYFAALVCFLIDYRGDTVLFWTATYCLLYAMSGLQNHIDLTQQQKNNGLFIFVSYFGLCNLMLLIYNFNWVNLFEYVWLTLWAGTIYIPFTELAKRITNDR